MGVEKGDKFRERELEGENTSTPSHQTVKAVSHILAPLLTHSLTCTHLKASPHSTGICILYMYMAQEETLPGVRPHIRMDSQSSSLIPSLSLPERNLSTIFCLLHIPQIF